MFATSPSNQEELKERIIKFLQTKDIFKDLEQSCIAYHHYKSSNFQPFLVNLVLQYNEIPEGYLAH